MDNKEVKKILAQRLEEPGTLVDGIRLITLANIAKSPTVSQEKKESALRNLQEYKPDDDLLE